MSTGRTTSLGAGQSGWNCAYTCWQACSRACPAAAGAAATAGSSSSSSGRRILAGGGAAAAVAAAAHKPLTPTQVPPPRPVNAKGPPPLEQPLSGYLQGHRRQHSSVGGEAAAAAQLWVQLSSEEEQQRQRCPACALASPTAMGAGWPALDAHSEPEHALCRHSAAAATRNEGYMPKPASTSS